MLKVVGYKCQVCGKLSEGHILNHRFIHSDLLIIRFKMDCCGAEHEKYWDMTERKHYIMEVKDEEEI